MVKTLGLIIISSGCAILPSVTRGENFDEVIFVSSEAKNVGMATVTARLFNEAGHKKSPSKITWGDRGEYTWLGPTISFVYLLFCLVGQGIVLVKIMY